MFAALIDPVGHRCSKVGAVRPLELQHRRGVVSAQALQLGHLSTLCAVAPESPTLPGIGLGRPTRMLAERLSLVASSWADPGVSMADAARMPWTERAAETLGHDAGQVLIAAIARRGR